MFELSSKVDHSAFTRRLKFTDADRTAFATAAARGMDPFVPFDTGALAGSATPTAGKVVYTVDYASYPYEGHGHIKHDHHARATSHWDAAYVKTGMRELIEEVRSVISRKG